MGKIAYPIPVMENLIPQMHPNRSGRPCTREFQIVHGTGNIAHGATDTANANYFKRGYTTVNGKPFESNGKEFRFGSTHKIIDRDSMTICIPDNEECYGAGDRPNDYNNGCKGQTPIARDVFGYKQNTRSIQYELAMDGEWDRVLANAVEIIAIDAVNNGIPKGRLYRHHDVSGKACPGWLQDDNQWKAFVARVYARMDALLAPVYPPCNINVNGTVIAGILVNGKSFAPVRLLGEMLGAKVDWNAALKKATINSVPIDSMLVNSVSYAPVRLLAESLGAVVTWDAVNQTVIVKK